MCRRKGRGFRGCSERPRCSPEPRSSDWAPADPGSAEAVRFSLRYSRKPPKLVPQIDASCREERQMAEKDDKSGGFSVSRRDFLKTSGVGSAVTAATSPPEPDAH